VNKSAKLTLFTLMMLIVGSIDSIRNLPSAALFGSTLVFFFIFSAIVFLIPVGLVSATLASTSALQGGIYGWVKKGLGEKGGMLAIWLQWINTMVWYPSILSFIAATATYLINPKLAQNKLYLVSVILSVFWFLTWVNTKGIKVASRFAAICSIVGMVIPMLIIITVAIVWAVSGQPLQIHFTAKNMLPTLNQGQSWSSLTAIITSFLGLELASVHIKDVDRPKKTYPRALLVGVFFILFTMIAGSLAIALVVPQNKINLVTGIIQVFHNFFSAYHMQWMLPVLVIMLVLGALGGMVNWMISPARGLLQAAQDGYLPKALAQSNKHGMPGNVLLLQAIAVSISCVGFVLMPSVNGSYWLLTDLSTELYVLMYVLMFIAAIKFSFTLHNYKPAFTIPGGKIGMLTTCAFGLIGCLLTLCVGFFPPSVIDVGGFWHYELVFSMGILIMLLPVLACYVHKYIKIKNLLSAPVSEKLSQ